MRIKATILAFALLLTSCVKNVEQEETPKDTTPPTVTMTCSSANVFRGRALVVTEGKLFVGKKEVASWTDDRTPAEKCVASLVLDGKPIKKGAIVDKAGTLEFDVTDEAGNKSSRQTLALTDDPFDENGDPVDIISPTITVVQDKSINVFGGREVHISEGKLFISDHEIASWEDETSPLEKCIVSLTLNDSPINSGDILEEAGTLAFFVTDEAGNSSSKESIELTYGSIYGLEEVTSRQYTIYGDYDLIGGVYAADGLTVSKVEVTINEERIQISDPSHFIPELWGEFSIVYTLTRDDGNTYDIVIDHLRIDHLSYSVRIPQANNAVYDTRSVSHHSGVQYLRGEGVFDLKSLVLEAIENGTYTQSSAEVKKSLGRCQILWWDEAMNFEQRPDYYDLFEYPAWFDKEHPEYSNHYLRADMHAVTVGDLLLISTKEILRHLGRKIWFFKGNSYENIMDVTPYVKSHPNDIFFTTNSTAASGFATPNPEKYEGRTICGDKPIQADIFETLDYVDPTKEFYQTHSETITTFKSLPNVYFPLNCIGNYKPGIVESPTGMVMTYEEGMSGKEGIWNEMFTCYKHDGVMGSELYNSYVVPDWCQYTIYNDQTLYPSKEAMEVDYIWTENSSYLGNPTSATSWACPAACGKAYLITCACLLGNPAITKEETRRKVRETANASSIYYSWRQTNHPRPLPAEEFYGDIKARMNPMAFIPQFFSTIPTAISTSSKKLVSIEHGLHYNSVIIGPGIVDEHGTEVTESNYTTMFGKKLYIDPSKLYKYGYTPGGNTRYVDN